MRVREAGVEEIGVSGAAVFADGCFVGGEGVDGLLNVLSGERLVSADQFEAAHR